MQYHNTNFLECKILMTGITVCQWQLLPIFVLMQYLDMGDQSILCKKDGYINCLVIWLKAYGL